MDIQERRDKLAKIALDVQRFLPDGWTIDISRSQEDSGDIICFIKSPLRFAMGFDYSSKDTKLSISCWDWPYYESLDYRNRQGTIKTTIWPGDLHDPKEEQPSMSVSAAKTPEQIAKDITRRLIGEYERIWQRCKEKADAYQAHEDKSNALWAEICSLIGKDVRHGSHYFGEHGRVEKRGSTVRVELDLTADQFASVLGALGIGKGEQS